MADFKIPCKYRYITSPAGKRKLREYAVGYCKADGLLCRPKHNQLAVMFFFNGCHFWTHLRREEFKEVFENET